MFNKNNDYNISDEVVKEGNDLILALFDANIEKSLGNLGGSKDFNLENYPKRFHKCIMAYLNDEIDSVTCCYYVMRNLESEMNSDNERCSNYH